MEKITAIVDPVTMLFCDDGMAEGRIVVEVPYNPDVKKECYSGDPKNPIAVAGEEHVEAIAEAAALKLERFGMRLSPESVAVIAAIMEWAAVKGLVKDGEAQEVEKRAVELLRRLE